MTDNDTDKEITDIIKSWEDEGHESRGGEDSKLPRHPGYVYRLAGDWPGWNTFLAIDKTADAYEEHERIDRLEDEAFKIMHPKH